MATGTVPTQKGLLCAIAPHLKVAHLPVTLPPLPCVIHSTARQRAGEQGAGRRSVGQAARGASVRCEMGEAAGGVEQLRPPALQEPLPPCISHLSPEEASVPCPALRSGSPVSLALHSAFKPTKVPLEMSPWLYQKATAPAECGKRAGRVRGGGCGMHTPALQITAPYPCRRVQAGALEGRTAPSGSGPSLLRLHTAGRLPQPRPCAAQPHPTCVVKARVAPRVAHHYALKVDGLVCKLGQVLGVEGDDALCEHGHKVACEGRQRAAGVGGAAPAWPPCTAFKRPAGRTAGNRVQRLHVRPPAPTSLDQQEESLPAAAARAPA